MKNVKAHVNENILTIEVDLTEDYGPSKSGKSSTIGTTNGIVEVPGARSPDVKFGLNVFRMLPPSRPE